MRLQPRTILVAVIGLAVWGVAIKMFLDWRAEEVRTERERADHAERVKPKPPKFGPGTGDFETYFTEKHPLSKKAELMRRLNLRPEQLGPTTNPAIAHGVTEDSYDVARQVYRIYVPENYSPQTPHGIIYYLGYKDTTAMPEAWKSTLNERHLIFIGIRNCVRPEWQHAAVALDAVHNLKKQYAIDEKRIYLFDFPPLPGFVGLQMGLSTPDIFTGFVHINRLDHYRNVPAPQNRSWPPRLGPPPADLLAATKALPHAFVDQDNFFVRDGGLDKRIYFRAALERDGFQKTLFINIADPEELHYPWLKGPWLVQTLDFLEGQK